MSKKNIISDDFNKSTQVCYMVKIVDDEKVLNDSNLRNSEILIYKKIAVFESVIKNIIQ